MGDKSTLFMIVVCALLIGGFVNYRRNAPLDAELQNRTYAELKSDDLDALLAAYEQQTRRLRAWVDEEPMAAPVDRARSASDVGGKAETFSRFQREANRWRAQRSEVLEGEATIAALQQEKSIRARGLDLRWRQILRRVTTF